MVEAQTNGLPCVISDRIPKDVHLTDLVTARSLDGNAEDWVNALIGARRTAPEAYFEKMENKGLDISGMLNRIYALYEGE
jgi:hypothetical protein